MKHKNKRIEACRHRRAKGRTETKALVERIRKTIEASCTRGYFSHSLEPGFHHLTNFTWINDAKEPEASRSEETPLRESGHTKETCSHAPAD